MFILFIVSLNGQTIMEYEKACNDNNASICTKLGYMYYTGEDNIVEQDYIKALTFYKKACELNNLRGCNNIGTMYSNGQGVDQNDTKALKYFTKSCYMGRTEMCMALGTSYEEGTEVPLDLSKAIDFFEEACSQKDGKGCYRVANLHQNEVGNHKNDFLAAVFLKKACRNKHLKACSDLGQRYVLGNGVEQNNTRAIAYFQKDCNNIDININDTGCFYLNYLFPKEFSNAMFRNNLRECIMLESDRKIFYDSIKDKSFKSSSDLDAIEDYYKALLLMVIICPIDKIKHEAREIATDVDDAIKMLKSLEKNR